MTAEDLCALHKRMRSEIGRVVAGQHAVIEDLLVALFAGGHVLLEGVPGLGKTILVRTLAQVLDLDFARIQFTPDLMPADITGTSLIVSGSDGSKRFEFQPGPVFTNILLADEINRATPKTQSALLEAMQERQVTVGRQHHPLREPFLVMATQNPLEMEGTYPLPEAQLDRFFFKISVGYPSADELHAILDRTTGAETLTVSRVAPGQDVLAARHLIRSVQVARAVQDYAVAIVLATHPGQPCAPALTRSTVRYGASPRGLQAMILAAKTIALLDSRLHVAREDIARVAPAALRHRIVIGYEGEADGITPDKIVREAISAADRMEA